MPHSKFPLVVWIGVFLAACGQSPTTTAVSGPVAASILSAEPDSRGYTIHVKLVNRGTDLVTLNPCLGPLQVKKGEIWAAAESSQPGSECPLVAALLQGGGEVEFVLAFVNLHEGDVIRYSPVTAVIPEALQPKMHWPESTEFVVR